MMRDKIQFYLAVAGAVILFDVVASFASRALEFDYTSLVWVSRCLYIASGYFGSRFYGLWGGVAAGLIAGLADSTAGWMFSSAIGPFIPFEQPAYTIPLIVVVIIIMSLKGAFFGFIGALLGLLTRRRSRSADA
jgi:hypothetical protein